MASFTRSTRVSLWSAVGLAVVAGALAVPTLLTAQEPAAAPAAAAARPQPSMQAMGRGFRTLNGQVSDATKNDSSLALLAEFETQALAAKGAMPPTITALPEAERPAKVAAYKKEMIKLIRQAFDAEEALLSGDNAKAKTAVDAMNATQMEGHGEFRGRRGGGGGARRGAGAGGAPPAQ